MNANLEIEKERRHLPVHLIGEQKSRTLAALGRLVAAWRRSMAASVIPFSPKGRFVGIAYISQS